MPSLSVQVALESDVGLLRQRNEDLVLAQDLTTGDLYHANDHELKVGPGGALLAVLDGMGGTRAGDRASQLAGEVLAREVLAQGALSREGLGEALVAGLIRANSAVRKEGRREAHRRGMGTTLTAAALLDGVLLLAHVGDSRAYLLRGEHLVQITEDQSLGPSQDRAWGGQGGGDGMAHSNVILQALGISDYLDPLVAGVPLVAGDMLLLCSDGISSQIPGEEIRRVMVEAEKDLAGAAAELTSMARKAGGQDNASVVLARFEGRALSSTFKEGRPAVDATPLLPPSLVRHLRHRMVRQVANSVGMLLVLLALLVGLILLVQG